MFRFIYAGTFFFVFCFFLLIIVFVFFVFRLLTFCFFVYRADFRCEKEKWLGKEDGEEGGGRGERERGCLTSLEGVFFLPII